MTYKREKIFREISDDLIAMSKVVFVQMEQIENLLINKNNEVKNKVVDGDIMLHNELILDSFEVKLRRNVIKYMVLHSPRASDMRKIISCYDININLERIGDLLINIKEHLVDVDINGQIFNELYEDISMIFAATNTMLNNAVNSFVEENVDAANQTISMDDIVDDLYVAIRSKIVDMSANQMHTAEQLREIIAINDIGYNIERIADNATNIVEASVYLIEGRNIQHEHN